MQVELHNGLNLLTLITLAKTQLSFKFSNICICGLKHSYVFAYIQFQNKCILLCHIYSLPWSKKCLYLPKLHPPNTAAQGSICNRCSHSAQGAIFHLFNFFFVIEQFRNLEIILFMFKSTKSQV